MTLPRILLVGVLPGLGNMHLPRHLARAGLEVVFFGASACMASRSGHVRTFYPWTSDNGNLTVEPFIECVRQSRPDWIVPLDEISAQVLQQIGIGQLQGGTAPLPADVVEPVRRSLGDPAGYPLFSARRRASEIAHAAGIPAALQADVDTLDACARFARGHGYPVVLKEESSSGGVAAFILDDDAALGEFAAGGRFGLNRRPWVVQGFVPGMLGMHAVFAEQGRVLAQVSAIQISRRSDRRTAPSSAVKLIRHDAMAAGCAAFVAATGASGFHGWDFQLEDNGNAVMIEHNPRPISISHLGYLLGDDLCAALAAVCGAAAGKPGPGAVAECDVALFPDEWQRDPLSPLLHRSFHDAPWDDEPLFRALLQEQIRFV